MKRETELVSENSVPRRLSKVWCICFAAVCLIPTLFGVFTKHSSEVHFTKHEVSEMQPIRDLSTLESANSSPSQSPTLSPIVQSMDSTVVKITPQKPTVNATRDLTRESEFVVLIESIPNESSDVTSKRNEALKKTYSKIHGYRVISQHRGVSSRVQMIRDMIAGDESGNMGSVFLWTDSLVAIMDCYQKIEPIYERAKEFLRNSLMRVKKRDHSRDESTITPDLVIAVDEQYYVHTGLMILRKSEWTLRFLEDWTVLESVLRTRVGSPVIRERAEQLGLLMVLKGVIPASLMSAEMTNQERQKFMRYSLAKKKSIVGSMGRIRDKLGVLSKQMLQAWQYPESDSALKRAWRSLRKSNRNHVALVFPRLIDQGLQGSFNQKWILDARDNDERGDTEASLIGLMRHSTCASQTTKQMGILLKRKIHVLSAYLSDTPSRGHSASMAIQKQYCKLHGYEYHSLTNETDLQNRDSTAHWIKPRWVWQMYSQFKDSAGLIVWFDADAVIMDCHQSIEEKFIEGVQFYQDRLVHSQKKTPDAVLSADPGHDVNNGVFMLIPSNWTTQFLEDWFIMSSLWKRVKKRGLKDQVSMNMVLLGLTPRVLLPPQMSQDERSLFEQMNAEDKITFLWTIPNFDQRIKSMFFSSIREPHQRQSRAAVIESWKSFSDDIRSHVSLVQPRVMNQLPRHFHKKTDWIVHPMGMKSTEKEQFLQTQVRQSSCFFVSSLPKKKY